MAEVVHFHIGAPKTGTTYLQDRLHRNARVLREHGVDYLVGDNRAHFAEAMDLTEKAWGSIGPGFRGRWDELATRVRATAGRVILSHEIFAEASAERVDKAMRDLGDAEIHIIYSQRDMARQIPAQYQESAKHRRTFTFSEYLERCMESSRSQPEWWFWRAHSLPDVLQRWGRHVPPDRVHLVTAPQSGRKGENLLQRYCRALNIDPGWLPDEALGRNASLGIDETIFLQRLNQRLENTDLSRQKYDAIVRGLLIQRNLSKSSPRRRITLPPGAFDWVDEVTNEWIEWVKGAGIDVVGDLNDLYAVRPLPEHPWADPDEPDLELLNDAALEAVEVLVLAMARRRPPPQASPSRLRMWSRRMRLRR